MDHTKQFAALGAHLVLTPAERRRFEAQQALERDASAREGRKVEVRHRAAFRGDPASQVYVDGRPTDHVSYDGHEAVVRQFMNRHRR